MTANIFQSSDSVRSGQPLKYVKTFAIPGPLKLELGEEVNDITVAYETYGQLNESGDNAVLICHALSGDSHVAQHNADDDAGWWDIAVGPGKAIDTDRYFVVCSNSLGGCRGTTGPTAAILQPGGYTERISQRLRRKTLWKCSAGSWIFLESVASSP